MIWLLKSNLVLPPLCWQCQCIVIWVEVSLLPSYSIQQIEAVPVALHLHIVLLWLPRNMQVCAHMVYQKGRYTCSFVGMGRTLICILKCDRHTINMHTYVPTMSYNIHRNSGWVMCAIQCLMQRCNENESFDNVICHTCKDAQQEIIGKTFYKINDDTDVKSTRVRMKGTSPPIQPPL